MSIGGEVFLRHDKFKKAAEDFRSAILLDRAGKSLWANRARSLVIALKRTIETKKEEKEATSRQAKPTKRVAPKQPARRVARKRKKK